MKVLQLIDSLAPGGAERMAVNLANASAWEGVESHLMATRRGGKLEQAVISSVSVVILEKQSTLDLSALARAVQYIRKHRITVLHAHTTSYFFATLLKIRNPKLHLIWHEHHGYREHMSVWNNKTLYLCSPFFNVVITVNDALLTWCRDNLNVGTVAYLPNFVGDEIPLPPNNRDVKTLVYLANLKAPKNHLNLLKAVRIVANQIPDLSLLLIGKNYGDAYFAELKSYLTEHSLQDKVVFLGSRTDISTQLQKASIGIIASDSEGLPMALLEYGMARLAVVTTDVGQCREVVATHGVVVPPNDPKALAEGILTYMVDDEEKRIEDARAFNQHIRNNYSFKAIWPRLRELYST